MALLMAAVLMVNPSCDTAIEDFAEVLEHREVTRLGRLLNRMVEACEDSHAPVKASPTPHRGMGTDVERWRDLVADHFPTGEVDRALCIMSYESGGNPDAKNPRSSARGLFQILASLWAPHFGVSYEDLYDPGLNVRLARSIWDGSGWWAWSPYKRGLCR